jgi:hypothetical protein
MWQSIASAPFGVDLELAVIDRDGAHPLVFPCRRVLTGWVKSGSPERVDLSPTHWRAWDEERDRPLRATATIAQASAGRKDTESR